MTTLHFRLLTLICLTLMIAGTAQATFSIVAVDTSNGAIGSAGASCIDGAVIISGVVENIGAVHTQAFWNATNQQNADSLMREGLTPDSIISWLVNNDSQNLSFRRQYGVVTLAGPGASAAFTGTGNADWKGHLTGFGYSIQGNILLGPQIVGDMETAFLNTEGPLEDKLMAALVAADVPGADTRCLDCDKPAISAFIKVVHPGDGETPYLFENVDNTSCPVDPIPLLRDKYQLWQALRVADPDSSSASATPLLLPADGASTSTLTVVPVNWQWELPSQFESISVLNSGGGDLGAIVDVGDGSYTALITAPTTPGYDTLSVFVESESDTIELADHPALRYYLCGDCNADGLANITDAVYLINFIFNDGPAPDPLIAGDANCDGLVNITDAVYLIAYIFSGGPPPCDPDNNGEPDC